MARTDSVWVERSGGYTEVADSAGLSVLIKGTSKYLNFNTTSGETGYGIRDNAGAIEFKNSGGAWAGIGSAGISIGDAIGSGVATEILYTDGSGNLASDDTFLRADDTLFKAGIVTSTNALIATMQIADAASIAGFSIEGIVNSITDGNDSYFHIVGQIPLLPFTGIFSGFSNTVSGEQATTLWSDTAIQSNADSGSVETSFTQIPTLFTFVTHTDTNVDGFIVQDVNNADIFKISNDGVVEINSAYNLPTVDGAANGVMTTDGAGTVSFSPISALERIITTTDDATAVIDVDVTDVYQLTAIANATTFTLTGTPVDGQKIIVRFKDAGVTKGLTWTGFTVIGVTLPTATTAGKWHYVGITYNSSASAWHAISVTEEA